MEQDCLLDHRAIKKFFHFGPTFYDVVCYMDMAALILIYGKRELVEVNYILAMLY